VEERLMVDGRAGKAKGPRSTVCRRLGSVQQSGSRRGQDTKAKGTAPGWSFLLTSPGFWHQNCQTKTMPLVEKKDLLEAQTAGLTLGFRVQQLGWNG
jgi:hypothetical protein